MKVYYLLKLSDLSNEASPLIKAIFVGFGIKSEVLHFLWVHKHPLMLFLDFFVTKRSKAISKVGELCFCFRVLSSWDSNIA